MKKGKSLDIFIFLKGGVKGYKHPPLIVKALSEENLKGLSYNPKDHVPEMETHLSICKFFFQQQIYNSQQKVKLFEYAFYNKQARKNCIEKHTSKCQEIYESKVRDFLSCWESYIKELRKIKNPNNITQATIEQLFQALSLTNYRVVEYAITSENGSNSVKVSETIKVPKHSCFFDVATGFGSEVEMKQGKLFFKSELNKKGREYKYKTKKFGDLSSLEKLCTLITISISRIHSQTLSLKGEKSFRGRLAVTSKKGLQGIIKTLTSNKKVKESFQYKRGRDIEDDASVIKFMEILNYFEDPKNREKILFDLLLGAVCKFPDLNDLLEKQGYVIECDQNELRVINCLQDSLKHILISRGVDAKQLRTLYVLYGQSQLYDIDPSFKGVDPFVLFLNYLLKPNFVRSSNKLTRQPESKHSVMDSLKQGSLAVCIRNINAFFSRKENGFDRKKKWYLKYDGSLEELVRYHNRVVSKSTPLQINLIESSLDSEALKELVFVSLFFRKAHHGAR